MSAIQKLPREIELLQQAAAFLVECVDLDEVKNLRDKAEVLRLYHKKVDDSFAASQAAAEIKIRAERRMGELLREMPKNDGGRPSKTGDTKSPVSTLANHGIHKKMSSRTQAIAAVPAKEFEDTIAKTKQSNNELTSKDMAKRGQTIQRKEKKMKTLRALDNTTDDPSDARGWEIIHGHCVTVMGHPRWWTPPYEAKQAPAVANVRLIFADPPYNQSVNYGNHYDDDLDPEEFREKAGDWLDCFYRALAKDGSLWLLISHEWAWALCSDAIDRGFHLHQWITWYESFGVNCTGKFNRCSRALLWLVKDPKHFVFNSEAVTRPSDRQEKYNDIRANPDGKLWDDVWGINPSIPRLTGTCKERLPDFPTQLPLALLRPIISCASEPKDLILDPFSGSGTTGHACIELGRRFIGIELSPEFVELSRLRLKGVRGDQI